MVVKDHLVFSCPKGVILWQAVAWCRNLCGLNFDAVNDNIEALAFELYELCHRRQETMAA